ncbi:hypothetical protein L0657_24525 [Dyadobacter sp. CY345]|uniref:hypothetical protein n=1 Tax=Dyadobacter sp. CY345 TaxID=2909335 RepID=UPI001F3F0A39|nr:hypothetical protein [Dyadobacter sp. CY345]MCF2447143.1 hypothetical protein [Dyadobacter sp. CY345]
MQRPTREQLLDFFQSDIFPATGIDYDLVISQFYKRFDPQFEQETYHQIGIHIDRIVREPYVIEEGEAHENKTTIYFHFLKNPGEEFSFILWGEVEEQPFFALSREELLDFFEFRFRRFHKLLNR